MKNAIFLFLIIFSLLNPTVFAQEEYLETDRIEVFLIDAYVTAEPPHIFVLSFFTSDSCTSEVTIEGKTPIEISADLTDNHLKKIDITNLEFDSLIVPFIVTLFNKDGIESKSEPFELILPMNNGLLNSDSPGLFTICCFGGIIFGLPSPTLVLYEGENYFALSKEIPLLSFYSQGYNYPAGYISVEYQHVFDSAIESFVRVGYKHIIQIPGLEYVSSGVSYVTDLHGFNGLSPEVSVGLFRIYNVFSLYAKYRYNFKLGADGIDFHEISVGLYSNFFSFNL